MGYNQTYIYHPHQVTVKKKDMNKDNIQELLKPRYKVIADYPGNEIPIGTILFKHNNTYWTDGKQYEFYEPEKTFIEYPHLFRRLEWWEDRDVKDMPEYVKCIKTPDNFHFPDRVYRINYLNGIAYSDISIAVVFETNCYLPATETEYLNQTNQP